MAAETHWTELAVGREAGGGPVAPRPRVVRYFWVLLALNPPVAAAVAFAMGFGHGFGGAFARSLAITAVASTASFAGVVLTRRLEEWSFARLGWQVPDHGPAFYVLLAAIFSLPGMLLGLRAMAAIAARLGFAWSEPGFIAYRGGLLAAAVSSAALLSWVAIADAKSAAQRAELRLKEAEAQRLQAQLSALAAQMNPHLVFNALNTVAALIATDPQRAEETVVRLSEFFRGVLAAARHATHSLGDELRLCEAYLDVEKARFGERLQSRVEVSPDLRPDSLQVPVLLLQPLVENAVKHGLSGQAQGGTVSVRAQGLVGGLLELTVEDDGVGLGHSPKAGAGVGLATCRERLRLRWQERASLEMLPRTGGGTRAVLRFPAAP